MYLTKNESRLSFLRSLPNLLLFERDSRGRIYDNEPPIPERRSNSGSSGGGGCMLVLVIIFLSSLVIYF